MHIHPLHINKNIALITNLISQISTISDHNLEENQFENNQSVLKSFIKLPCKCGKTDHQRTNHSSCILNLKNKRNYQMKK